MLGFKVCCVLGGPRAQWLRVQAKNLTLGIEIRLSHALGVCALQ